MANIARFITAVDDEPSFTDVVEIILTQDNPLRIVEKINSGPGFMLRIENREKPMDIAIIDIKMPLFDITDCIIKIQNCFPQTYIIVASASHDAEFISSLFNKYHIWGYVLKNASSEFNEILLRLVFEAEAKIDYLNSLINGPKQ